MNIAQRYRDNIYTIDSDNFYLVQVTKDREGSWLEGRVGEIFVTFKYEFFTCCLLFPQVLMNIANHKIGVPAIQVKDNYNDETGQLFEPIGKILGSNWTLQKPENWADYIAIKEDNPGKISLDYARHYNNSLYNKE